MGALLKRHCSKDTYLCKYMYYTFQYCLNLKESLLSCRTNSAGRPLGVELDSCVYLLHPVVIPASCYVNSVSLQSCTFVCSSKGTHQCYRTVAKGWNHSEQWGNRHFRVSNSARQQIFHSIEVLGRP